MTYFNNTPGDYFLELSFPNKCENTLISVKPSID